MLHHLILFEWKFYGRKISFYVMLLSFLGFGILVGTTAGIAFPNITYNSPYAINFILGLFSLASLFPIVIIASQSLLREKDNHFEQVLYATPITIRNYFLSRFLLVFGVAVLTFLLFLMGYGFGHLMEMENSENWGIFNLNYYLNSFLLIVLPNIFLCTVIVCCTAWLSKHKMLIYLSGLGIYVLYMVSSIFSNSPLLANASPVSDSAMNLSARLDPFGMAAFFEQTRYWTALQKNTMVLELSGNLLYNRIAIILVALALLYIAYKRFRFKTSNKQKKKVEAVNELTDRKYVYTRTATKSNGKKYFISTIFSFLKIDLKSTLKSIPFVLLIAITLFIVGMEMYGAIEGGIRLPQYFATTALMINTILATIPFLLLLAMLFYGSELVWKSKSVNFSAIEHSTPFSNSALFLSKFGVLFVISLILIVVCIVVGILFQISYQYPIIDWSTYFSLFYFIGLPASFCGLVIIAFQYLIRNKYIALAISAVFLVLTNTSFGKLFGFTNPLSRFANFLHDAFSDINGFGYFPKVFSVTMLYSLSFAVLLSLLAILFFNKSVLKTKWKTFAILILPFLIMLLSGIYIFTKSGVVSEDLQLNWQQDYEEKYKFYKNKPQPSITDVKTSIDLYPEENSYKVQGTYILVNKTQSEISEVLINTSNEITWNSITSSQLTLAKKDEKFGQYLFKTKQKLLPNDSISICFNFEYKIEPLKGHQSFNAIVENGAFMRISNYFPSIGYNFDNEIEDKDERKKREMPLQDALTKVDAPLANPYNYEFINFDAVISTSADQTAISVGELVKDYSRNNRNYIQYKATTIPFRFAVSSAKYAIQKSSYNYIAIEIFYEPKHHQNILHLINSIKKTLQYCETNFGKYPYKTIRFAEISSFTRGFSATAYPATIYINEAQFHLNLSKGEGNDIINELAAHELSHQWWGNAQLQPDYREGSGVLTETLAQYTQLMLYKNEYGKEKMLEMVKLYKDMYDSEKAFSGEEPLYTSKPDNANVIYNKGLVKMYELYVLIGEENINVALKRLLKKYTFPLQPATTMNLIEELKVVTKKENHKKLDDIFKE
ncbi:ABC transporter permease/M1 family aminopeptidase [Cellulophaga baltica]|uniref:Peptidase family M1 n=1 Tax=Cellulophaga baltica TaxID=76594 RepID=A0A1G7LRS1_9FLAO|nr:M1 family aminopeptidase [Cellulophaga baltica]SDF52185.1 Peptidase family M1 [Cellulophaga baltica]